MQATERPEDMRLGLLWHLQLSPMLPGAIGLAEWEIGIIKGKLKSRKKNLQQLRSENLLSEALIARRSEP